jgi:hypothetical protein
MRRDEDTRPLGVGERVVVDGQWTGVVTATSVYSGAQTFGSRLMGVSVRPDAGGRARVCQLGRVRRLDAD